MTSTLRAGSVTYHVLRNDVLQQHIDVGTGVEHAPYHFVAGAAMIPRLMACRDPGACPSKRPSLLIDGV
jgi:hypothetical protein